MIKHEIITDIYGGIAQTKKIGQPGSFRFGTNLDISDPNDLTLFRTGTKDSGTVVTGLIKWIEDATPYNSSRYAYDNAGAIYEELNGTWTKLKTVASSHGQGLTVHNDYLYYVQDTQVGRYGPLSSTGAATFDDNWQTGLNDMTDSEFGPAISFRDGIAVGHGNKVAWWDGAVWDDDALILPSELNARSITKTDQYIVIGAWRGNAVTDSEDGYIFLWDTLSDTFNDFNPTEGALNAMGYYQNGLVSIQGNQGYIYTDAKPFNKMNQLNGVALNQFVEVFPGAMASWKGLLLFGISDSDSNVVRAVYSYGSSSALFREALNCAISISTGNSGSTVQIGAVKGIGSDLYIAWRDNITYGVDKLDEDSLYAVSGTYESMIVDGKHPGEDKLSQVVVVSHLPLAEGESISIDYKQERAAAWSTGADAVTNATEDSIETKLYVKNRFKEFEWRTTLAGDGTSTPTVTQQKFTYETLIEEKAD